jgi:hypothetical protein
MVVDRRCDPVTCVLLQLFAVGSRVGDDVY